MSDSSVPPIAFTPTGAVFPDESVILAGVQADYNAAFGGNLNPSLSTPQGQLCSSTAAIIGEKNDQFAYFLNQIDPATASGFMQDAIGRIYFLTRLPATPTLVQVLCTGLVGVVIPVGALVIDMYNNKYACVDGGVIGSGGSITLTFACTVTGQIECPAGAITTIYQTIPGWDSATNPAYGVIGKNVESRSDFEYRRQQSVALNGRGSLPSIYANVFNVPNVVDVFVVDNPNNFAYNAGTTAYPMLPHSILVSVAGGEDDAIARAIWLRKDVGADYNGNTTVVVEDDSGYSIPVPTYTVKFLRPASTPILFDVKIANLNGLPFNVVSIVKDAIIAAFNGGDGGARARLGSTIFAGRFYAPISAANANITVLSLLIGISAPTAASITMGVDQLPTISPSNITVSLI
jgi:hypothetical protein